MFNKILPKAALLVFFVGMLSACGGGGNNAPAVATPAPPPIPAASDTWGLVEERDRLNNSNYYIGEVAEDGGFTTFVYDNPAPITATVRIFRGRKGYRHQATFGYPHGITIRDARDTGRFIYVPDWHNVDSDRIIPLAEWGRVLCSAGWLAQYVNASGRFPGTCLPSAELRSRPSYNSDSRLIDLPPPTAISVGAFNFSGDYHSEANYRFGAAINKIRIDGMRVQSNLTEMITAYRFGITPIDDDNRQLFIGADNYRNGIIAAKYNRHQFGIIGGGEGFAVRYEFVISYDNPTK